MDTEGQPSESAVSEGVTNGDAIPSDFQDDAPVIQPPLSHHHQVASQSQQDDHCHCQQPLQAFWSGQLAEIKQTTNFKTHSLPLARIKKIMKADSNIPKRVAGEAPLLFAKACEMFIQELTLRAWLHTEEDMRRTLQKKDVTAALASTEVFDFLVADSSTDNKPKGNGEGLPPPTTAKDDDDSYGDYYWDDYSPPWSPEPPSPDLRNVTCDDPRYYTYIHDYYSL
ncbi:nuclear transcription factor Y subunit C-3 [Sorghum bicolor]|uniref:Transcription factor CBF/NF-Y/archaeal histone domain-containing protein n=1 Tax=Sorghum bicolor TaxID=4558 RepID=C5YID9_SORBI|nr:nuclear transcription factor Y subunit C-3 [Sorghum bicolor]EES14676.1 hypothetical protein SORBI_3007G070100 [Sorghum bicolor]KXG24666.1 hypothetical protein SORBI_3007G070100 [Sorghum bicolor]|eukprot:XP_021321034.1 nuclear transcription factor Y subunit C-3 [Sorghum bicolor]